MNNITKKAVISSGTHRQVGCEFDVANRMWIAEIGRLKHCYGDSEIDHFSWLVGVCVAKALSDLPDEAFVEVAADRDSTSDLRIELPAAEVSFAVRAGAWTEVLTKRLSAGDHEGATLGIKTGVAKALRFVGEYEHHHFSAKRPPSAAQFRYMRSIIKATNVVVPIAARIDIGGASDFITRYADIAREYGARPGDVGP